MQHVERRPSSLEELLHSFLLETETSDGAEQIQSAEVKGKKVIENM